MKVLVTGVSSYTGMCIAETFAREGASVTGTLTQAPDDYQGRKRKRLERATRAGVVLVPHLSAEGGELSAFAARQKADVWVHHHHPMEAFRSPAYDVSRAREVSLWPLRALADAWQHQGVRAVLLSGTYFEPGEGGQTHDETVTPYAHLKAEVGTEVFRLCRERGLPAHKVIITTPIGALENEDRLTPQMLIAATESRAFLLRSSASIFDVLPGEILAKAYVSAANEALRDPSPTWRVHRPSGWITTAGEWGAWVERYLARPLGLELKFELAEPQTKPTAFRNPPDERVEVPWKQVAQAYVEEWKSCYPFL